MSKSMEQVLMENYPDFDPLWVNLVEDKGDGVYFKRQNWPAEWFALLGSWLLFCA